MRIAIAGGGPGGLYLAALLAQLGRHDITVWEQNAADDTFGFGVVLSDETLGGIEQADPAVFAAMSERMARWDDIDVHHRGAVSTSGGHGFAAIGRRDLLGVLQRRCAELGVTVHYRTRCPDAAVLQADHDLVVAADGVNSAVRAARAEDFGARIATGRSRYMWLGTDRVFPAFTFDVVETPCGVVQLHGYPYSDRASTIVVETSEPAWERLFRDRCSRDPGPGESDLGSLELVEELFTDRLDGAALLANASRWSRFRTLRTDRWHAGNLVLLGDAAHTAHFSIGSGTKLVMEDALALAACLHEQEDVATALAAYEAERRPVVASTQRAAAASQAWFEDVDRYVGQERQQFAFNLLTRSRRVTHDNLRTRDAAFVESAERWFCGGSAEADPVPPMFTPVRIGGLALPNRVVVSAMDVYSARDGVPADFHLVHLGGKALGGAGLVMTEMVCVSPTGRITPGCTGLWNAEQEAAWRRVVDFVHSSTPSRIGVQLGHSGRKGSTRLMWEGIDEPLDDTGGWPVVGPSAIPYSARNAVPHELTAGEMRGIRDEFAAAARAAARCEFDLLELHVAHGYLLSSFVSPLSNRRTDRYGGDLDGRLRYPLEVFDAVREAWPAERPMSVRISATDWHPGGIDAGASVAIARAFAEHGADAIDVSTGQVVSEEAPEFGRSYQTPFADRIRNSVGRPHDGPAVIAVGAISSWDDVNSILLAGRADLCALGRPHLYDPQWTLHAAAEQDYAGPAAVWPEPFAAGSRRPRTGRTDGPPPRLDLLRRGPVRARHARWNPAGFPPEPARG
ncbi:bifunctional salicylyl-CoA 5-hydroxylase/oxidoreductase [Saccharopolyspora sp. NFXS83]|uniref:bifunctional salicylyl-CoA 5-hydroxylase/oxidoreductase n=1 Tax=Saccharopolyspora sp. NFXS83 TaxID=2993560 RepID=UPI00224A661C|nr:bifunctional salicylyl-CoA 5-hydroxylase/oxidoreductase [Saccharopolyspora sp. NFXS83]MCX2730582.1 bifunctional salicylyl-CoA 5-hydroxylase/oxidoreductase [Saccharopolyspora sp. NFXS83]